MVVTTLGAMVDRRRKRRRRLAGLDAASSILVAWDEIVEQLRLEGLTVRPSSTPAEAAHLASTHEPDLSETVEELADLVDLAAYSSYEPDDEDATTARAVVAVLERDASPRRRLRRRLSLP